MNEEHAREQICEIGRRIYARQFAAGNDGNLTVRLDDGRVVCTPTSISKGFMQSDDLCTCDLEGKQLEGKRRLSSEILMHVAILRARPDVLSVVHCHPPHATAFAITHTTLPTRVLPEVELFLGDVPIVPYTTPGGQELANSAAALAANTNALVLANHGTVTFADTIERAFWWTEILDAYCRILILSKSLGEVNRFSEAQQQELISLRAKWQTRQ